TMRRCTSDTTIGLGWTPRIHERQRYGRDTVTTIHDRTARTTNTTTEPATRGIGWLHGIASQVSLPNMSALRLRTNRRARAFDIWPRTGRKLQVHDRIKQARINRAIGERTYVAALLAQREITRSVQCRSGLAHARNPLRESVSGHRPHREVHVGKAAAAVLCGLAIKLAGLVRRQMQLRHHSVHRGDH